MAYMSMHKGVVFIEGAEPSAQQLGAVEYEKKYWYNSQLKNLDAVKDQLAEKTLAMGGNAVLNFTYGQKCAGFFKSFLLALDDNVNWYGNGVAAVIPEERMRQLQEKINR